METNHVLSSPADSDRLELYLPGFKIVHFTRGVHDISLEQDDIEPWYEYPTDQQRSSLSRQGSIRGGGYRDVFKIHICPGQHGFMDILTKASKSRYQ